MPPSTLCASSQTTALAIYRVVHASRLCFSSLSFSFDLLSEGHHNILSSASCNGVVACGRVFLARLVRLFLSLPLMFFHVSRCMRLCYMVHRSMLVAGIQHPYANTHTHIFSTHLETTMWSSYPYKFNMYNVFRRYFLLLLLLYSILGSIYVRFSSIPMSYIKA